MVTRTGDLSAALMASYQTADGTAVAGSDYIASGGVVTIPAGSATATIGVPIIGDTIPESDKTFSVHLTGIVPAFTASPTLATGTNPNFATAADLNGDGRPDLIVANYGNNSVSVFLNTTAPGAGTATFAAQVTFAVGSGPKTLAVADINGDGLPDIVATN